MVDLSILALFGFILTIGVIGSDLLKKIHFPEILGFLLVGLSLNVLLRMFNSDFVITDLLSIVVAVTLGFIGFNLGSELDWQTIRSTSSKILVILLFESLLTFLLVTMLVYSFLGFTQFEIALLFGALASATAPAGTAAIFWEDAAKGPLTTTTMFILALDDVVAILLTDFALDYSTLVLGDTSIDLFGVILTILYDVGVSSILGIGAGLIAVFFLRREDDHSEYVDFVIGSILVCIGLASILEVSYILPTMIFGVVVSSLTKKPEIDIPTKKILSTISDHVSPQLQNIIYEKRRDMAKEEPHQIFHEVYRLASPIIATFFILMGLSLDLSSLIQIGVIGLVYMGTRTVSKVIGASLGAWLVKTEKVVQQYLGVCLMSQAGVALGLAVFVSDHLTKLGAAESGLFILNTITATTILFQILAPVAIKWAINRSGEGRKKNDPKHTHFPMYEWTRNNG
jgi:Kef-type K+ transport system membrane component KefB